MFIEQAYKGDNAPWKVILTTLMCSGIFILNFIAFLMMTPQDMKKIYQTMKGIPNNLALIVNLAPFVLLLGLLFLLVKFLHERSLLSLTTSRPKIDFSKVLFSFSLIVGITLIGFAISYYSDNSNIVWNFNPEKFIILLIISLLIFPLQIGFEEYLFRGYLMQQIGIVAKNRWVPLLVTSVLFGVFHSANPEVAELGLWVMVFYIGTGLLLGITTLLDEGMEIALGFHLGNNLMAALLITSDFSALQTDALFRYSGAQDNTNILREMILSIALTYPLILLILSRKYGWKNWREKLSGKVRQPETILQSNPENYGTQL